MDNRCKIKGSRLNILFTGASSFTGMWFVKMLSAQGCKVVAPLRGAESDYKDLRKERIAKLKACAEVYFSTPYESKGFEHLIESRPFDLFCHHAADVTNYKSPSFDPISALKNNVGAIESVLSRLKENGCSQILLTGSIFEPGEGAGSEGLRAVSPYGLSKGLTSEVFKYYCEVSGLKLGKFVIPNPFGPFEEFRFTSFLIKNWFEGKKVDVTQPAYVRDNIHVSLLAKAYVDFAKNLTAPFQKYNPSGYPESQGAFTARFANEMKKRLPLKCEFTLASQSDFPEPKVRLNTDLLNLSHLQWDEEKAWDELAEYYQKGMQ